MVTRVPCPTDVGQAGNLVRATKALNFSRPFSLMITVYVLKVWLIKRGILVWLRMPRIVYVSKVLLITGSLLIHNFPFIFPDQTAIAEIIFLGLGLYLVYTNSEDEPTIP